MEVHARKLIVCFLTLTCLLLMTNCGEDEESSGVITSPTEPEGYVGLFVTPDGTGVGTVDDPFGTIQAALDSAESDSSVASIYVACGGYIESLVITGGIAIYGGRNPNDSWAVSGTDSTFVHGLTLDNHSVGVAIVGTNEPVYLKDMTVMSLKALLSSGTSYGIYCLNADSVTLENCNIFAGNGADGVAGREGLSGEAGESGDFWSAGQYPVAGGEGGEGADCPGQLGGEPGDSGTSYLDSPPGGAGGFGAGAQCCEGGPGQDGGDGYAGAEGAGATLGLYISNEDDWFVASANHGQAGGHGGYGSGGGGGGGVGTNYGITGCWPGSSGSGGGAGATPGLGGTGGGPGGSSIAVLAVNSNVLVTACALHTGSGGNGGVGGRGGGGGVGGSGGRSDCLTYCAGHGGKGGDGGDGGSGGGGGGGSSVGVVKANSTVTLPGDSSWDIGIAGAGGSGGGSSSNGGETGYSQRVLEVLIAPAAD